MSLRAGTLRPVLWTLSLGTCLGVALGAACGGDDDPRPRVLAHVAHAVAEPAFAAFRAAADDAAASAAALCDAPTDATLGAAREAWHAERDAWSRLLPFSYGPIADQMQQGPLDFWPARPDTIETAITDAADAVDQAYIDGKGTSAKGMPALEYLLFGPDPASVLASLTDPSTGARRCAYAEALAADIAARAAALEAAWSPGFADTLARAGAGSELYPTSQAGLDAVVNGSIEALAVMVKSKLDTPLGNLTGAAVDPELLESRFAASSVRELQRSLDGVWSVYHGADLQGPAEGISSLVQAVDPGLDERVRMQHARAVDTMAAIPDPIADALTTDRGAVQLARDELDTLRRMLKLDVASALGVTLSLSDNDGD
jgi:predicted lipoprotein